MNDQKLDKLQKIIEILGKDTLTQEDFVAAFEKVLEFLKKSKDATDKEIETLRALYTQAVSELKSASRDDFVNLKERVLSILTKEISSVRTESRSKFEKIQEKIDSIEESKSEDEERVINETLSRITQPEYKETVVDDGDQIIVKVNDSNGYIDRERIEGLDEELKRIEETKGSGGRVGWGAHPLVIKDEGIVVDKTARIIDFTGSGVTVTRESDGTIDVSIPGGSGAWMPPETPDGDIDGVNTEYQLTYVPVTYSGVLYVNGQPHFEGIDWTISDGVITMTTPIDASLSGYPLIFHGQFDSAVPVVPSAESSILLQDGTEIILQDGTALLTN